MTKLEKDEDTFFYIYQRELEEIVNTVDYENYNVNTLEKDIDEKIDNGREILKEAILVVITIYYIRGLKKSQEQLNKPIMTLNEDILLINQLHNAAVSIINDNLQQLRNALVSYQINREEFKQVARKATDKALERARKMSATESMKAMNTAMINNYKKNGGIFFIKRNEKRDRKTCDECRAGHGEIYRIEEADNILPAHPYCRGYWEPIRRLEDGL